MKPFIRKNKNTIQQRRYLESVSGNTWPIRKPNILFIKEITAPKKYDNSQKRAPLILFRAKHCAKNKYRFPQRKYDFQQKGVHTFFGPGIVTKKKTKKKNHIFFGQNIVSKKIWDPQKSMSSKKEKELIFFSGQTLCQKKNGIPKKYEFQKENSYFSPGQTLCQKQVWDPKKWNSYIFRAKHCVEKSMGSNKKYEFQKKKNSFLFRAKHCAKHPVRDPKKKIWVPKKKELIPFSGQTLCQKPSTGSKKSMSSKKKKPLFFSDQTLCRKKIGIQQKVWVPKNEELTEKNTGKKVPKVWVPFFFGTHILFLDPIFFWHNVWPEKNMSSFFF